MRDLFIEIYQTLKKNKLRTALTGIAVSWGVFMLIILLSLARGVTNSFEHAMQSTNRALITVYSGHTSVPYKGNAEGRWIKLKESDMKVVEKENAVNVSGVSSTIDGSGKVSSPSVTLSNSYQGVFPEYITQTTVGDITEGRFINKRDMEERSKVIVLPRSFAEELFPPDAKKALGSRVNCNGLSFRVVGIYDDEWRKNMYIPFTTARLMAADKEDLGRMIVSLKNVSTEEDGLRVQNDIKNILAQTHEFDPEDDNAVYLQNSFVNSIKSRMAMKILTTSVWILGILTLLTGIVGISNIMFVTVKERTHEIGIRRAIGAKPRKILIQVIVEAVSITLLFGYLGVVAGMIATQIISSIVGDNEVLRNPTVSLSIAFNVALVLVIAGTIAGLFPALKALKIKPVEALRDE